MKTYPKFRKPPKLILACMTRSKSVQIAWILMILINLTHFFIDLLEVFFLLSRKPFHYRSLFKKWKNLKKKKTFTFFRACCELVFRGNVLEFVWFSRKIKFFGQIVLLKDFFLPKNRNYPSIVFLIKSYNFHVFF